MRLIFSFLIFFCWSCSVSKKYDHYVGKTKDDLMNFEGTPSDIRSDTTMGEQIIYMKNIKFHNPKYLSVTEIITFYIDRESKVYKWSRWKYKETPPTAKPQSAID